MHFHMQGQGSRLKKAAAGAGRIPQLFVMIQDLQRDAPAAIAETAVLLRSF